VQVKCKNCGTDLQPVETPDVEIIFDNLKPLYCDPCADRLWAKQERERQTELLKARFSIMRAADIVSEELRLRRFSTLWPHGVAQNPVAWAQARGWTAGNLYVYGSHGVGKSHLCQCLLNRAFQQGRTIAETTMATYAHRVRVFGQEEWVYRIGRASILLLDDVDKCTWDARAVDAFWQLMDSRGRRVTFVTSNVDLHAMTRKIVSLAAENTSKATAALDRLKPITEIKMEGRSLR
jgi:DNA replication protein DnaC